VVHEPSIVPLENQVQEGKHQLSCMLPQLTSGFDTIQHSILVDTRLHDNDLGFVATYKKLVASKQVRISPPRLMYVSSIPFFHSDRKLLEDDFGGQL
jgi:hypothetical protein